MQDGATISVTIPHWAGREAEMRLKQQRDLKKQVLLLSHMLIADMWVMDAMWVTAVTLLQVEDYIRVTGQSGAAVANGKFHPG